MQAESKRLYIAATAVLALLLLPAGGCLTATAHQPADALVDLSGEDEMAQLIATLRYDLERSSDRLASIAPQPRVSADPRQNAQRPPQSINLNRFLTTLPIPVAGLTAGRLEDNFGVSRDGGRRTHRGIDIFAARGTAVVAVADGYVSYIGEQPKAGRCLWLIGDNGYSFFYAHLDRWLPGLYEGMPVRRGEILGYVGNTGNAKKTPPHLHFAVLKDDEALNPYHLLKSGLVLQGEHPAILSRGFGRSAR
ncbi:MAG TPA: M23 family metallopeptidase [Thermoanaerobaculia bacterium]|nr:M23 family metallopeptidase [Thermoanaerobaculia bacterium]